MSENAGQQAAGRGTSRHARQRRKRNQQAQENMHAGCQASAQGHLEEPQASLAPAWEAHQQQKERTDEAELMAAIKASEQNVLMQTFSGFEMSAARVEKLATRTAEFCEGVPVEKLANKGHMVGLSVKVGELALEDDMLSFSLQQELAEQNRQQQQIEACTERLFFIDRNAEARPAVPWNHYKLAMMTEEEEMQFLAQHPEALQAVPSGPSLDDTLQVMECLEEFSAMCKKIARSM